MSKVKCFDVRLVQGETTVWAGQYMAKNRKEAIFQAQVNYRASSCNNGKPVKTLAGACGTLDQLLRV